MKLKKAAQMTACHGFSTRVATTVAIEFAASWNPFTKSKTSAIADDHDDHEVGHGHGQACFTAMDCTSSLASSTASIARSMASTTSFHRRMSSASCRPLNSSAITLRYTPSASLSRRSISSMIG